ncbi:hypothetical protein [Plantactinospora endophytica]|uniref:ANTAR domain-containing protein n=1 Tax=Plantactinospora endophytica TaxID=673535 RepID=A0ABQ4EAG4_9ACTN|nr:hypothetical protein [Plantactinospora endophytica]GIG91721.1 hypothetical protein Pen02_66570 [Plantactinospora endophytica]
MSLEELTHEEPFYAAIRLLAETAWRRGMTVETLLTLTDLLDPLNNPDTDDPVRRTERPSSP